MSTELALLENGNYDAAIMAELGFGRVGGNDEDLLPRLRINTDHVVEVENDDGSKHDVSVVAGCFKVRKDGVEIFSQKNPVVFRVFMQRFDYRHYDEGANDGKGAYIKNTILANDGEEPIDDNGTVACLKVRGKAAKGELSPEQKIIQKAVQSFRIVFGTVSFDGFDPVSGETVEVRDFPVHARLRGTNYMPIGDILKDFKSRKIIPMSIPLTMTTKREKKGQTTFYIIQYDFDTAKRQTVTATDISLVKDFSDYIKNYNDGIRAKHTEALKARSKATEGASSDDATGLDDDFGTDLDDSGTEVD